MSERDELDLQRAKENPGISKAADTPAFFFFFLIVAGKVTFQNYFQLLMTGIMMAYNLPAELLLC